MKTKYIKLSVTNLIRKRAGVVVVLAIAVVGTSVLISTKAATISASLEAEKNAPNNIVVSDTSASGGKAIRFGAAPTSNINPPVAADSGKSWSLSFNEDFDSSSLDLNKWTPCFSWAYTYGDCTVTFNNGREAYEQSQVQLSNGTAKLVAAPLSPTKWGKDYKSGLLSTTNKPWSLAGGSPGSSLYKFTYGYVESRLKMPSQKGYFTAFWMLPVGSPNDSYTYPYEIDILEALGGNDAYAYQTIHYNGRSQQWQASPPGQCKNWTASDLYGNFHTYGVNWQPSYVDFYIDGMKCGRFTTEVWKSDMEIILNLMVDVDWQKAYSGLSGATGTGTLEVDYVKVWQQR